VRELFSNFTTDKKNLFAIMRLENHAEIVNRKMFFEHSGALGELLKPNAPKMAHKKCKTVL